MHYINNFLGGIFIFGSKFFSGAIERHKIKKLIFMLIGCPIFKIAELSIKKYLDAKKKNGFGPNSFRNKLGTWPNWPSHEVHPNL